MARESYRRRANALIWILAVLGLIMLIIWLSLPRLTNRPRVVARRVVQRHQLRQMTIALDLFKKDFGEYPPSDANDSTGKPYCGAMKLAEAMTGLDMLGFNSNSVFRVDRKDANGVVELYLLPGNTYYRGMNLKSRYSPLLPPEDFDTFTLAEIYGEGKAGLFDPNLRVMCGPFKRKYKGRKLKAGMPILYYKADTSKTAHSVNNPDNPDNIYNYRDNHALLALGVPGDPKKKHPLFTDPKLFYKMTKSDKPATASQPVNADTFILISAGDDGLYGTADDICNFDYTFPRIKRGPEAD